MIVQILPTRGARRWRPVLLLFLACQVHAPSALAAGITLVQSASTASNAGSTSVSRAFTTANTAGNLIVAVVSYDTSPGSTFTCSDSRANPYLTATFAVDARHNQSLGICYAPNIAAGANTVTVRFASSKTYRRLLIHEYAGVATSSPLDKAATNIGTATTGANSVTSTPVAPSLAGELIFGAVVDDAGTTAISAGTGYSLKALASTNDAASADRVQAAAAPIAATFTFAAAHDYLAHVITFKPTSLSDTTPPVITSVNATAITSTSATIQWTTNELSTSQVEYGPTPSYGQLTPLAPAMVTSHAVTLNALTPQAYNYRVRAIDAAGNEAVGANNTFTTGGTPDTTPPSVPSLVSATPVSIFRIDVSWNASTDPDSPVAGYNVFRDGSPLGNVTATSYSDTNLTPNTTYSYTVNAYDAAGNTSAQSAPLSATTPQDTTAPSQPQGLSAAGKSSSEIDLSWGASTDNVGVTGYRVNRNGAPIANTTALSLADTGLGGGTYTYTVAAFDAAGNLSTASAPASASTLTLDVTPPTVPMNLRVVSVTSTTAVVAWDNSTDNIGVAGYHIYRGGTLAGTTVSGSYSDAALASGTTYSYSVAAFDATGNSSSLSGSVSATTLSGSALPLTVSANGRYLVDQTNTPFLMVGDSPQALIGNLSEADAESYFADRQANGFNTLWINLLCNTYTYCNADGSTFDGLRPFTSAGNLATPNAAYFARVDDMIRLAAKYGLTVLLDPIETGGWLETLRGNGVAKARAYGQYLGNRYKSFDNIVWMSGNDFQTWPDAGDDALVQAVAVGIKDTDNRHLHTVELNYNASASLDDSRWAPLVNLDAAYTYRPTYAEVLQEYNRSPVPVFMVEANYEFEQNYSDLGTPGILRRQEYWTLLSGAAGQLYGSRYTVSFTNGWKTNLDTAGVRQLQYVTALFRPRRWQDLVPDQSHSVVIAGYGTPITCCAIADSDYVTAARTPDGALVMAYMPHTRTITVAMSTLAGSVTARWYDPSNGTFAQISGSPFANSGSRAFTPPGRTSDGDDDWVLVLESVTGPDLQKPSVPTNLTATSVSAVQVSLVWTASVDNVGVAGYRVYRGGTQIATVSAPAFTDSAVAPQSSYTYGVAAYDAAGNVSAVSAALTVVTPIVDNTPPTVPAGLTASNVTSSSATLAWTAATDPNSAVAGYRVYRNGALITSTAQTSFADTGLSPSTAYAYTVAAYDPSNNASAQSAPVNVVTASASAAPAFVQVNQNELKSGTANAVAFPTPNVAGNLIVAYVLWSNTGTVNVTDSRGNSYSSANGPTAWGNGWRVQVFVAKNIAGGTNTVTATFQTSISAFGILYVHEYRGLDRTAPVDAASAATGSSASVSGAVTTTTANDLIFAAIASSDTVTAAGSGYNLRTNAYGNMTEDRISAATGSVTATATQNASSWVIQLLALKPASP